MRQSSNSLKKTSLISFVYLGIRQWNAAIVSIVTANLLILTLATVQHSDKGICMDLWYQVEINENANSCIHLYITLEMANVYDWNLCFMLRCVYTFSICLVCWVLFVDKHRILPIRAVRKTDFSQFWANIGCRFTNVRTDFCFLYV